MHIFLKRFFLIILSFLSLNICAVSMESDFIDKNNINHAKIIAKRILERQNSSQLENGANNIMKDHSEKNHSSGDSYFTTDNLDKMKDLIKLVADDPDKFKFYTVKTNYRLAISKKISEKEAKLLFNKKNIGYDEKYSAERFRVVLCFGINSIAKLSDSNDTGGFLTGFPTREEYTLGL